MSNQEDWVKKIRRVRLTRPNTKSENIMIDAFIWLVITPFIWFFFIVFAVPEFLLGNLWSILRGKGFDKDGFREMRNFFK
jgi:hypothetical protein